MTNIDKAGKELKKITKKQDEETSTSHSKVSFLKRLVISALLTSGGDHLAAKTIIGTEMNMRANIHNQIPQPMQKLADTTFVDPALRVYGKAALGGYEKIKHGVAQSYGINPKSIKPSKLSLEELSQLAKQPPPVVKKRGIRIKRRAFIGAVNTISSQIDYALDAEEIRMQQRIDRICRKIPNCAEEVVRNKLKNLDQLMIEKFRKDLKGSAAFLLKGYACAEGIDCDVDDLLDLKLDKDEMN